MNRGLFQFRIKLYNKLIYQTGLFSLPLAAEKCLSKIQNNPLLQQAVLFEVNFPESQVQAVDACYVNNLIHILILFIEAQAKDVLSG